MPAHGQTNLASIIVIQQRTEEIGDADLDRLMLQNEVLKRPAKNVIRGAFGVLPTGLAIITHFAKSYKMILLKKARLKGEKRSTQRITNQFGEAYLFRRVDSVLKFGNV
uniref:Uncharacterized protein n=1 Tax=Solanum tuberosum TaxID=4113 RepID=M1DQY6_SOLTU